MTDWMPDSRLQKGGSIKGVVSGINPCDPDKTRKNFVPIWCFSCTPAKLCGYVEEKEYLAEQERGCVGFLCPTCSEKYGYDANFLLMPDEVMHIHMVEDEVGRIKREIEKGNLEGA